MSAEAGQAVRRVGYAELRTRSNRLSGALAALELRCGDRVGTLGWNTQHHLEMYYALMGSGIVYHTLNPRVTIAHLAAMINEAEDRALAVASNLAPLWAQLAPLCPNVEYLILMDGEGPHGETIRGHRARIWGHEALLQKHGAASAWGAFEEETPAGLCYTSGTTGAPKGVLAHHPELSAHAAAHCRRTRCCSRAEMSLLIAVPMFHTEQLGTALAAPAVGAKLVLPGRAPMALTAITRCARKASALLRATRHLAGVLDHLDAVNGELPALQRVLIGGANCPDALIRRMESRLGARVQTSWGMTELSPLGTVAPLDASDGETRASGRPPMGLDLKLADASGADLPMQRGVVGHLKVKARA